MLISCLSLSFAGESENLQLGRGGRGGSSDGFGKPVYSAGSARRTRRAAAANGPYFRSHGQTYRIKIGDPVTLTCYVGNLGEYGDDSSQLAAKALTLREERGLRRTAQLNLVIPFVPTSSFSAFRRLRLRLRRPRPSMRICGLFPSSSATHEQLGGGFQSNRRSEYQNSDISDYTPIG